MAKDKHWFRVETDRGVWRTLAASERKAGRNAQYRLVMNMRSYATPTVEDWMEMRDIKILSVVKEDEA